MNPKNPVFHLNWAKRLNFLLDIIVLIELERQYSSGTVELLEDTEATMHELGSLSLRREGLPTLHTITVFLLVWTALKCELSILVS